MRDDTVGGDQGMEQGAGAATAAASGRDRPAAGEEQGRPGGGMARGVPRRFVPLAILAAIVVTTVLHYNVRRLIWEEKSLASGTGALISSEPSDDSPAALTT